MIFYNREGRPIAYSEDNEKIYLFNGKPVAYFFNEYIYGYNGIEFGWFNNGWVRDLKGQCVFYTKEAIGGMIKPVSRVLPVKGVKRVAPIKAVRRVPRIKTVEQLRWSDLSSEAFFMQ